MRLRPKYGILEQMTVFWGLVLGLPLLAFGVVASLRPDTARRGAEWFFVSRPCAIALTIFASFWTGYECDIMGIDVFDAVLKRFPGEVWVLAAILAWLVIIWMPKNLPMRALTGILMLIPAELFKVTRFYLPSSGVALVHLFVVTAYLGAVVGMYGMFYPWRLEKGLEILLRTHTRSRVLGVVLAAWGAALCVVGCVL